MCSEPMPWRCHRLLISNTLTAGGWSVQHIMSGAVPREHVLGQWGNPFDGRAWSAHLPGTA